jgi:hypothetical protein
MEIDEDKVDDAVLALLRLTLHDGQRAWKGFDWDALDRLHRKGLSPNPFAAVFSPVSDSSPFRVVWVIPYTRVAAKRLRRSLGARAN